jgi:outer membrane protein
LEKMSMKLKDLQATAAIALLLVNGNMQMAGAQVAQTASVAQSSSSATPAAGTLLPAPSGNSQPVEAAPKLTEPLYLRDTGRDYTHLKPMFPRPLQPYTRTSVDQPRLGNTPRLDSLIRDGKIYLSLSDAVLLALENNFDIAIARINLDIADTDILRSKAGAGLRGVSTGLVANTLGGSGTTVTGGGGPDDGRIGRRRRRRQRAGVEHQWRRAAAGEPGPDADQQPGV